jgi:hypothetical protein
VKNYTYHNELQDLIYQFGAAFDDIVIKRFNKNREPSAQIEVRYIYAPKEKVLFDIVNKAQNITLPVVAINITSVSRDSNRVFNKIDGFDVPALRNNNTPGKITNHVGMPVPVNVGISMSILTNYQSDMDQILSNFIPYNNPYIVISWQVPNNFHLSKQQEIRSHVMWDGNISLSYPIDQTGSDKPRIAADTTFIIEGWLFPAAPAEPSKNILFINNNFYVSNFVTSGKVIGYDQYYSLSAANYTYPLSAGLINELETVSISAAPDITNIYYSMSAGTIELYGNQVVNNGATITLIGHHFQWTNNIILSSSSSLFGTITAFNYTYYPTISGENVTTYTVMTPNVLTLTVPTLTSSGVFDIIVSNAGGWGSTKQTGYQFIKQ